MPRSTKIVATLGPACNKPDVLRRMLAAGVDVVRLNFSHGTAKDHVELATLVREVAHALGREVAIMADLQGPKIRIGRFADGKIELVPGATFILDAECERGDATRVGLDYRELVQDVGPGSMLLLDDGLIKLEVESVDGPRITTRVILGGMLSNNKGINRMGGGLSAPALTTKDMDDVKTAAQLQADYLAVSFPKSNEDMYMARQLMRAAGGRAMLIAKI
jgi:pyruvate kinase